MTNFTKTIIVATVALCCFTNAQAQENARGKTKGKVMTPGNNGMRTNGGKPVDETPTTSVVKSHGNTKDNIVFSLGGGVVTPSSATKDNAYLVNSPAINADVFIPLFGTKTNRVADGPQKGWDGWVKGFGLNVNATYVTGGSSNPSATLPTGFAVTGATGSSIAYKGVDNRSPGFIVAAGPQLNIGLGNHFIVSPILSVGYISITQKVLNAVQTTSYNGKDYDFNLTNLPETKISGLTFNPAIRLQYMITSSIGLYAEGSYLMGPTVKTTTSSLIPNGAAQTPGNTYNLQQLQTGTYKQNETVSTNYNAIGFGGGVVFSFGRKGWDGTVKGKQEAKLKPPYRSANLNETLSSLEGTKQLERPKNLRVDTSFLSLNKLKLNQTQVTSFLKDLKISDNSIVKLNPKYFKEVRTETDISIHKFILTEYSTNLKYVFLGDEEQLYQCIKFSNSQDTIANAVNCGGTCCCRTCGGLDLLGGGKSETYCVDCACWKDFCYCPLCPVIINKGGSGYYKD